MSAQPISGMPLTAILKGHFEGTSTGGAAPTSLPSLEQSLEWKPLANTTIQAGLRQQQYQEFPGVDHELNEALFADWSQKIVDDVTKLAQLASEVKSGLDQANKRETSADLIRKTEEIEKLARDVKQRMKG